MVRALHGCSLTVAQKYDTAQPRLKLLELDSATLIRWSSWPSSSSGQIIHHKKLDYRGVVFDVDATFQGSDEWYESVARSRPPKDRPWYHVLVDGAEHTTYVAERHLESEERGKPIEHPLIAELCGEFAEGRYSMRGRIQ